MTTLFCCRVFLLRNRAGYGVVMMGMTTQRRSHDVGGASGIARAASSFPCTLDDSTYGGMGSTFPILERAMAFNHALHDDALPGSSDHGTMDCPCITNSGVAPPPPLLHGAAGVHA